MGIKNMLTTAYAWVYKNRAAIETVAGMVLIAGGTAIVISKARQATDVYYDVQAMMDDIHDMDEENGWESKKERNTAVRETVWYATKGYLKCYTLGVGMEIAGLALVAISDVTMSKYAAAGWSLASSYAATIGNIKERVVADQGEDKWNEYYYGPQKTDVEIKEDGTIVQTTTPVENPNKKANLPPFTIMFDSSNPNHSGEPIRDRDYLERHEIWLDQKLGAKGWLTYNDICDDIGAEFDKSVVGSVAGIPAFDENGNRNHFSFGLGSMDTATQRFRDGVESNVILRPNVVPNVFDVLLKQHQIKLA